MRTYKFRAMIPFLICKYGVFVAENPAHYEAFSHQMKLKFSSLNETTRAVFEQVNVYIGC